MMHLRHSLIGQMSQPRVPKSIRRYMNIEITGNWITWMRLNLLQGKFAIETEDWLKLEGVEILNL